MTTHTRTSAQNKSVVASMQARHLVPLANKICAKSRYGFLRAAVSNTVMLTVRTRKNKVHILGCVRLKANAQHTPVPTSPVGFKLEECCQNVEIATPLASHAHAVARLEGLEYAADTVLGTTIRSEFYRIVEIDRLIADCDSLSAESTHSGYTVIAQALRNRLESARESCDIALASLHFRMAQLARIAVGPVRQDSHKKRKWRFANYPVLHALSGGAVYPFDRGLEVPGAIADLLEAGYNASEVMEFARLFVERDLTYEPAGVFRVHVRDLTEEDAPRIAEFLRRVRHYLDRIAHEAANPKIVPGKPQVVVQTSQGWTAAEMWWASTREVSGNRPTTLKVDAFDYEWMRHREVTFAEAHLLSFPVRVGQKWGITRRRDEARYMASDASRERTWSLGTPGQPDVHYVRTVADVLECLD